MVTNIFAQLGFSFNKSSETSFVKYTNVIKDSVISLGPVFNEFQEKLDEVSHVTKWVGLGNAVSNAFGGIKSIVGDVVGGIKNVYGFADEYAQKGDKISKTSRLLGLTVKDYQALSSAALDSGMSIEEMDSSLKKFSVNLAKARGGDKAMLGNFSKALYGNNSDPKRLASLKTNRDVIIALASSYKNLKTSEDKAFLSSELFGKSGLKMSEVLSQGGESLKLFLDTYDKGFSQEGAENAEKFTHEFQMMHEEFEQIKMSVAQNLFPVFKELFQTVTGVLRGEGGDGLKKQFKDVGTSVGNFIVDLLPRIPKILDSIIKIVDLLSPELIISLGILLKIVPALSQIVTGVIALKPLITFIIGKLGVIMGLTGGALAVSIGGILVLFYEIYSIVKQFYDNWDMWCSFVQHELTDAVNDWIDMFVEDVKWLWNGFKSIFIDPFLNFFKALPDAFSNLWDGFKNGVSQIGSFIYNTFFGAISGAINAAKGLLSSLPLVGSLFGDGSANVASAAAPDVAAAVQQSGVTTTNRFAVDFNNVPRGTTITPPAQGDFDWSRSYTLAGGI